MAQSSVPPTDAARDLLAHHCIAARALIEDVGTPVMRRLIDLLLFEIGIALTGAGDEHAALRGPAESL